MLQRAFLLGLILMGVIAVLAGVILVVIRGWNDVYALVIVVGAVMIFPSLLSLRSTTAPFDINTSDHAKAALYTLNTRPATHAELGPVVFTPEERTDGWEIEFAKLMGELVHQDLVQYHGGHGPDRLYALTQQGYSWVSNSQFENE